MTIAKRSPKRKAMSERVERERSDVESIFFHKLCNVTHSTFAMTCDQQKKERSL